jgi:polyphosphate kinase
MSRTGVLSPGTEAPIELSDPSLYINRELSLLAFQRRVLEEAEDTSNPLLERVKFLSIVGSNLDEFFMIRVAGLLAQIEAGIVEHSADGLTASAQLTAIRREVKKIVADAQRCLNEDLIPALREEGIALLDVGELNEIQRAAADRYFAETIFPVLTPLALDPGRPFPHISNLSLNVAAVIRDGKGGEHFARVKVPDTLPRFVPLGKRRAAATSRGSRVKRFEFVWIEQLICANLQALFPGMEVMEAHPFHVTRDADIAIQELEAEDLLETMELGVRQRRFGDVVRLMVSHEMPVHIQKILISNREITRSEVFQVRGTLAAARLMSLYALERPDLKYPPFVPAVPDRLAGRLDDEDFFSIMRRNDVLLHHPFESFQPVVEFLRACAKDENVLAIKMVLYRVGKNSPVVDALLQAVRNGKQVAVLVELRARFDEESNIEWAKRLESEGVHVVYGLIGLKIHCKVALVVRREDDRIRRYLHLGTGNYNAITAHLYTDLGLLTCDDDLAEESTHLFNYLTGYSEKTDYRRFLVAPVNMRKAVRGLIEREIEHVSAGRGGEMILKMNSLVDSALIRSLYKASRAGVKVRLLVRGVCCLRPGVPGVSENIEVTSIVGRFLEHSRIYYFRNGGDDEVYLGSADLMPRNLDRRVETLFPIRDSQLLGRLRDEVLGTYLADNVKARRMQSDGHYRRISRSGRARAVESQTVLIGKQKKRR